MVQEEEEEEATRRKTRLLTVHRTRKNTIAAASSTSWCAAVGIFVFVFVFSLQLMLVLLLVMPSLSSYVRYSLFCSTLCSACSLESFLVCDEIIIDSKSRCSTFLSFFLQTSSWSRGIVRPLSNLAVSTQFKSTHKCYDIPTTIFWKFQINYSNGRKWIRGFLQYWDLFDLFSMHKLPAEITPRGA